MLIEAAASTALNSIISSACQPNNGLHERRMYGLITNGPNTVYVPSIELRWVAIEPTRPAIRVAQRPRSVDVRHKMGRSWI